MKKEQNMIIVVTVALLLVIFGGVTYAYFASNVINNDTTSMQITASENGTVLVFTGGENVTLTGIYPREEAWLTREITLNVSNVADAANKPMYMFNMVVEENDYLADDIMYTFEAVDDYMKGVESGYSQTNRLTALETNYDIAHGTIKNVRELEVKYILKVYFKNAVDRNQNIGDNLNLRFYISYSWGKPVNLTRVIDGNTTTSKVPENTTIALDYPKVDKEGYSFKKWTSTNGVINQSTNTLTVEKSDITINAVIGEQNNFEDDTWSTIAYYAKTNPERYELGSKKCIALDGITTNNNNGCENKEFAIRVVNNTPCDASQTEANGFSQTTCGLVLEFADIINTHNMNPGNTEYKGTTYQYGWNVDGWPASNMYTYINGVQNADGTWDRRNTLFSRLPEKVSKRIIDTYVVSGHGSSDRNDKRSDGNWESIDKLYLLSTGEVYKDCTTSNCYDTASYPYNGNGAVTTRQLGYYANYDNGESIARGVTTANYSGAIKQLNNANSWWWLRAAYSNGNVIFRAVNSGGNLYISAAYNGGGVAPAFRIG